METSACFLRLILYNIPSVTKIDRFYAGLYSVLRTCKESIFRFTSHL